MSVVAKKRFVLEINGIPQYYAQKVTPPEKNFGETKYSIGRREKKLPSGSFTVSDMTVEGLFFSDQVEDFAKEKINKIIQGVAPLQLMEFGRLIILDANFIKPIGIFELTEVWVKQYKLGELDLNSDDPIMESLVFSVGDFQKIL